MKQEGIGLRSAEFYKLWSESEKKHDENVAQQIIREGIKRKAQPIELLLPLVEEKKRKQETKYNDGEVIIEKKPRRVQSTAVDLEMKVAALTKSTLQQSTATTNTNISNKSSSTSTSRRLGR